jgi:hypothetical protein
VASRDSDAVAVFARDGGTGELTFVEAERDGFGGVDGLDGASAVAISDDGAHVYVAAVDDGAVATFSRNPVSGALGFVGLVRDGVAGASGLAGARSVVLSPGGSQVYVSGVAGTWGTLAVFGRDAVTGALDFIEVEKDRVRGVFGLFGGQIAISPDGSQVYSAGGAVMARDASAGDLRFVESGTGGTAVSPDSRHVYSGLTVRETGFECGAAPLTGCRSAGSGGVRLIQKGRVVSWAWQRGQATDFVDFGDPRHTRTHYAFCVYDESAPTPALVFRALAPAGGTCRFDPSPQDLSCWRDVRDGYRYRDDFRTPEGLSSMRLKEGADGKARITLKASGDLVGLPSLPLGVPVRAQLQAANGECWETTHSSRR